jgi:hypothetical protein
MFGMLDYRAAKLFWLLGLPLSFAYWFTPWLSIAVAVLVASEGYPDYSWLAKIGIAISAYVVTGLALGILVVTARWCLKQGFFWVIDVVPSKGADPKEAEAIVLGGKRYLTTNKLNHHIDQWTDDDLAYMARLAPWRVGPFFQKQALERAKQRIRVIKENFERTGKQFAELSAAEQKRLIGPYEDPPWQIFIRNRVTVTLAIVLASILIFVH